MVFTLRLSPNYGRFRDYVISQSYNQGPLSHVTHSEINSSIWGVFEQWLKVVSYVYANGSSEFVSNSVSCVCIIKAMELKRGNMVRLGISSF